MGMPGMAEKSLRIILPDMIEKLGVEGSYTGLGIKSGV
jgi:hypothetical protein